VSEAFALYVVPLGMALLLGGVIGFEREWHGRPAGLRTHILVCLSATMLIVASRAVSAGKVDLGGGNLVFDPNRMGAGIVTGIGFLGAATVIRSGDYVRGLTTAACIWYVAGLGIVLGSGHFAMGAATTGVVLFVLVLVNRIERNMRPTIYRRLSVLVEGRESAPIVAAVRGELEQTGIRELDVASNWSSDAESTELTFHVSLNERDVVPGLVERLSRVDGVNRVRWRFMR